jgi:hypothetical protein
VALRSIRISGLDTFQQLDLLVPVDVHSLAVVVAIGHLRLSADANIAFSTPSADKVRV